MANKIMKILTPNDVGSTGSHQSGLGVSKKYDISSFFPELDQSLYNPEKPFKVFDTNRAQYWHFRYIWYNSKLFGKGRDEPRITKGSSIFNNRNNAIMKYFNENNAQPGDIIFFEKCNDIYYMELIKSTNKIAEELKSLYKEGWKLLSPEFTYSIVEGKVQDQDSNTNEKEVLIQQNAAIIGQKAESYFIKWARNNLTEWGDPEDLTDKVGHGYDIFFPLVGYCVEIKGCVGNIENIRLTRHEWDTAQINQDSYYLVIISQLNQETVVSPEVKIIKNPYEKMQNQTKERLVTQTYYEISSQVLNDY
tara:strand:+ start:225 stop:1142 length:918 start_codon:yes stop_codon:yes gene_type:complete